LTVEASSVAAQDFNGTDTFDVEISFAQIGNESESI
jgi:hypothetical protein